MCHKELFVNWLNVTFRLFVSASSECTGAAKQVLTPSFSIITVHLILLVRVR